MNDREKLEDLLYDYFGHDPMYSNIEAIDLADFLATNGVTVRGMQKPMTLEAQVPKWISVEDRLPEKHGQIVVGMYNQHGDDKSILFPHVFTWHAYGENGYVKGPHFSGEGFDGLKVYYWMPLPELPKEEEK